jgi:hypothetical protein
MAPRLPDVRFGRRAFLLGSAATVTLAACGGSSGGNATATSAAGGTTTTDKDGLFIVQFFGNDLLRPGIEQRGTFGIADQEGILTKTAPDKATFHISTSGQPVGQPIVVPKHSDGLPRPYYPLVFTPPAAGVYDVKADTGTTVTRSASFQVVEASKVAVPQVGDAMRSVATPTPDDKRGVNPICTRSPECPLHDVSLDHALTEHRPLAFLVATPKFCQVAICGPVLDILLSQQDQFPSVRMLHAEVYTDDTASITTPAVQTYSLDYEPALFLASADGILRRRLDTIFDTTELQEGLRAISA